MLTPNDIFIAVRAVDDSAHNRLSKQNNGKVYPLLGLMQRSLRFLSSAEFKSWSHD
ncbi:hypothetical protein PULV_a1961 [Pseudoalteromonas ulvae UL12]|nr:hypothetical protein [Pseudoalteromonas ulvae UL12]